MEKRFPVNGPRQPVYNFMRDLGFVMSNWSDKMWRSADGIDVQIYGAGSMARVSVDEPTPYKECELDQLPKVISEFRGHL